MRGNMKKKDLISRTAELLRQKDARKDVPGYKSTLHISDDDGNKSDFDIRISRKGVLYTASDVSEILDALLEVTENALRSGENISLSGFGVLDIHKRAERSVKIPGTDIRTNIAEHYVPKFTAGSNLKLAVKLFELNQKEAANIDKEVTDCGD